MSPTRGLALLAVTVVLVTVVLVTVVLVTVVLGTVVEVVATGLVTERSARPTARCAVAAPSMPRTRQR
jgi:hypothetical protein